MFFLPPPPPQLPPLPIIAAKKPPRSDVANYFSFFSSLKKTELLELESCQYQYSRIGQVDLWWSGAIKRQLVNLIKPGVSQGLGRDA